MDSDIERGLPSKSNEGNPSNYLQFEQEERLMADKELPVEKSIIYKNHEEKMCTSKISDQEVLTVDEHKVKFSQKNTDNKKKFENICDKVFPIETGVISKGIDVKSPEKHIDDNKKYQRYSDKEFLIRTDATKEPSQKSYKNQAFEEQKSEITCDKEFPKKTDIIVMRFSDKHQKKCIDSKWKQQETADEESIKVNSNTEKEPNEKSSQPPLISTKESTEKKADIFDIIGSDGLWQRCIFIWKICFAIPTAFHYMIMTFFAPNIDYWCSTPLDANWTMDEWNIHGFKDNKCYTRYKNITMPFLTENFTLEVSEIKTCNAWEYDTSFYTSTVISQWDLVCDREWLSSFSLSIFNIGTLISSFVIGHLADKFGRKRIIVPCLTITVFSAIVCAISSSYTMFVVTRFITAFAMSGIYNVSYVLLIEIVGPKERSFYGVAMNFGWCIGFMCLPGIVWLLRDWFWIEIAITIPLFLLLLTCWMLPESPRWLMVKGRMEEAEKILIKSAKINGKKISNLDGKLRTVMDSAQKAYKPSEANKGLIDLLFSPGLWRSTLNIWLLCFVNSFTYYGLSYTTNALAGDPFVNFSLSGAVEIPGTILATFTIHLLGRKKPLALTMIFGGMACIFIYAVPENPWWLSTAVSMIGKCSVTIAINIANICLADLFPTVVRNAGLGSASFLRGLAAVLAPFVKELGNATHPVVPQILFGFLGCFSGAMAFLLPETKDLDARETLEDVVTRKKSTQKTENERV